MVLFKGENGQAYYDRLYFEFRDRIDPRLRAVLMELGKWAEWHTGKGIILTCLNRTEDENNAVGGNHFSAHLVGRAADLRSSNFGQAEVQKILNHLTATWPSSQIYAIYHDSGSGPHIHINIRHSQHRKNYAKVGDA